MTGNEFIWCSLGFAIATIITYIFLKKSNLDRPYSLLIFIPGFVIANIISFVVSEPVTSFAGVELISGLPIDFGYPFSFYYLPQWGGFKLYPINFLLILLILGFATWLAERKLLLKPESSSNLYFNLSSRRLYLIGIGLTIFGSCSIWQQGQQGDIRGIKVYIDSANRIGFLDKGRLPSLGLSILAIWVIFVKLPKFIKLSEGFRVIWGIVIILLLNNLAIYLVDNGGGVIILTSLLTSWLVLTPPKRLTKTDLPQLIGAVVLVCLSVYFIIYYRPQVPEYFDGRGGGLFIILVGSIIILYSGLQKHQAILSR